MRDAGFSRAVVIILIAILLFDIQGAIIKFLGDRYGIPQIATFRNIFGLLPALLLVYLARTGVRGPARFRLRQWPLAVLRGASIACAQYCLYLSLTLMEFATASTLAFAGPLFITALSVPILRHHVGAVRWLAVIVGFVGIVLVMRPRGDIFQWVSLLPICAAFGYGLSSVLVRLFDDASTTAVINFHTTLSALVFTFLLMLATDSYITVSSVEDWMWMLLMGLVGGMAVFSLIAAYRLTLPSNLSPFEYFGIPFSFVIGWVVFGEAPFERLIPGVFLIVGGGLLIFWRERRPVK
ncbi:MAG: DMT family transporter [Gammaproteobacteria bacterium]|nr:DMT family transporter [Gammaproteobacteria bacterium]MXY65509.1 DMT family transporter [Gammaproteobacteria bacterium]MYG66022.1 DMT family transporter [Gammaproteobacteria bacterium]